MREPSTSGSRCTRVRYECVAILAARALAGYDTVTAAAAVLALIPLIPSDFFGPMAVALMGGIATVLTLFFLPALYAAWFRVPVVLADSTDERRELVAQNA